MNKSKKIMMTMALGLSISALGFGLSANLDSNVAYAKEEQAPKKDENQIELYFELLRKVGDNKFYGTGYSASYAYINGVPQVIYGGKRTEPQKYKRGEKITFKLKETDEPGAPFVAEGEFDVPLKGYKNGDVIDIKLREIDQTPAKPEKENQEKGEKEKPAKGEKNKKEANKKAIEGLKAAKHQAEVTLNACHLLIKFTPETIKSVRAQLDQLMVKQEKLIKQANDLLAKYE